MTNQRRQTTMTQVRHMRTKWPGFRVKHRDKRKVAWEGELRPLHKTYTVGIILQVAPSSLRVPNPVVMALNPRLHGRTETPDEAIPHVYENPLNPLAPLLCLHHPPTDGFDPRHQSAADTVIPWTIEWLVCYEGWLATGKWIGGGVSH